MPQYASQYGHVQPQITQFPAGARGLNVNCALGAPGLEITGGSAAATASTANTVAYRMGGVYSAPAVAATMPVLTGGNLAFDNGTVDPTTKCCRCYTFFASVSATTGAVTYSVLYGGDFTKNRPMYETDVNLGDGSLAIVGFLYVKNEGATAFIPNSTNLDASGVTAHFSDAYGYVVA